MTVVVAQGHAAQDHGDLTKGDLPDPRLRVRLGAEELVEEFPGTLTVLVPGLFDAELGAAVPFAAAVVTEHVPHLENLMRGLVLTVATSETELGELFKGIGFRLAE